MSGPAPVSVLMPVYQAAATLPAALHSLAQQSHGHFTCIAVDDGSTDGSRDILEQQAREDERFQVLGIPHAGICTALNTGLQAIRSPAIARMDADDIARPHRLERQLERLQDPAIGLVGCRVAFGGDAACQGGYARYVDWTNGLLTPEAIARNRFVESPLPHPSVLFRRSLIEQYGGYREGDFPEDYDCWLRWLEAGIRMVKVDEELLTWNDPPDRLSRVDPRYRPAAFYAHKAGYLAQWLKRNNAHHPAVYIWGSGRTTRQRTEHLRTHGIEFRAYVDIDPAKIGKTIKGIPVIAPEELPPPGAAFVIPYVGTRGARAKTEAWLRARGYQAGLHWISAA